jgi:hypothetical protein
MQVMDSDRILNLLGNMPSNSIDMVLMTLWWSWHVCDEVVHGKSPPTLEAFMCFLDAYMESLIVIKYHLGEHIRENLLQDTIILWHLPKHTAQLWFFFQVPLQCCVLFAKTHHISQNRKFNIFLMMTILWPVLKSFSILGHMVCSSKGTVRQCVLAMLENNGVL